MLKFKNKKYENYKLKCKWILKKFPSSAQEKISEKCLSVANATLPFTSYRKSERLGW